MSKDDLIRIDGSYGEGGGQILRTSLMLAAHLGRPLEIINIRKNRRTPGLMPQHLTAVRALQNICGAEVKGDGFRSEKLYFKPNKIKPGKYTFDIAAEKKSAGSASLVLQTMAFPLFLQQGSSTIRIKGGTHVPWSPPATYLKQVFFPMLARLGFYSQLKIMKWGFYPEGGGELSLHIKRFNGRIKHSDFTDRGKLQKLTGLSAVCSLPMSIADRQRKRALEFLGERDFKAQIATKETRARSKGTLLFLTAEYDNVIAGFSRLGEKGKPAEILAEEACQDFINFQGKNVGIGHYLADQLLPYLCLSGQPFKLDVSRLTSHLLTNCWVISRFLDVKIDIWGSPDLPGVITIEPKNS